MLCPSAKVEGSFVCPLGQISSYLFSTPQGLYRVFIPPESELLATCYACGLFLHSWRGFQDLYVWYELSRISVLAVLEPLLQM